MAEDEAGNDVQAWFYETLEEKLANAPDDTLGR